MRYSDFLENKHFRSITNAIRSILYGEPSAEFATARDMLIEVTWPYIAGDWRERFAALQTVMLEKHGTSINVDDVQWLLNQLNTLGRPDVFVSLLMAHATAPVEELLTPVEMAELTGTAESTWRNKASAGQLPGAIKKGKQWLIPQRYAAN